MFSLFVVALFFLMILTPCLVALRTRWTSSEPAPEVLEEVVAEAEVVDLPAVPTPGFGTMTASGTISSLEAEVAHARRMLALAEHEMLSAEARLAMARAKQAADHAAMASRAAAQAAGAALVAQRTAGQETNRTVAAKRSAKAGTKPYDGPVVDGSVLPESHPSMDFPRSRVSHHRAA